VLFRTGRMSESSLPLSGGLRWKARGVGEQRSEAFQRSGEPLCQELAVAARICILISILRSMHLSIVGLRLQAMLDSLESTLGRQTTHAEQKALSLSMGLKHSTARRISTNEPSILMPDLCECVALRPSRPAVLHYSARVSLHSKLVGQMQRRTYLSGEIVKACANVARNACSALIVHEPAMEQRYRAASAGHNKCARVAR